MPVHEMRSICGDAVAASMAGGLSSVLSGRKRQPNANSGASAEPFCRPWANLSEAGTWHDRSPGSPGSLHTKPFNIAEYSKPDAPSLVGSGAQHAR